MIAAFAFVNSVSLPLANTILNPEIIMMITATIPISAKRILKIVANNSGRVSLSRGFQKSPIFSSSPLSNLLLTSVLMFSFGFPVTVVLVFVFPCVSQLLLGLSFASLMSVAGTLAVVNSFSTSVETEKSTPLFLMVADN